MFCSIWLLVSVDPLAFLLSTTFLLPHTLFPFILALFYCSSGKLHHLTVPNAYQLISVCVCVCVCVYSPLTLHSGCVPVLLHSSTRTAAQSHQHRSMPATPPPSGATTASSAPDNECYSSGTLSACTAGKDIHTSVYTRSGKHGRVFTSMRVCNVCVVCATHGDVGEGCSNHQVEDPGLLLDDVGGRQHHPEGGEEEEEDRGEEGEEGLVQTAVLQSLAAVTPGKEHRTLCH